ncbi:MAG: penicillin acylase family protein [Candidatus Acidiferrum sp.]
MRRVLRVFFWSLAVAVVLLGSLAWWYIYRPLPQIDGSASLPGLKNSVLVERDGWGVPHIHASSVEDLAEAQGYVMAQDRLWQMDLLRRVARGELSEIFGPPALDIDKKYRVLGFSRAARREAATMGADSRSIMDAYARGVNHFIEQHLDRLPIEFSLLRYKPAPWQASDTLVISAYMYETLTNTWERKLARAQVTARIGKDRAGYLYSADAPMDRPVVGNLPASRENAQPPGDNSDDPDNDLNDDMPVLKANNTSTGKTPSRVGTAETFVDITSALWSSTLGFLQDSGHSVRDGLGSNNWVVSGAHTASGKPLLANDTHLELSVPSIWYRIHLTAPGWHITGFTLPGAPMVVIGHNDRIAWGFTNSRADVQDLYAETFNPSSPDEYLVNRAWVKAQARDEIIHVKGGPDEHFQVLLTRHGPIVRREADVGYALRWTATEPGGLGSTYNWLGKAQNWKEFREILKDIWGPGQNVVYADIDGNIGYVLAARLPLRKTGHGEVPVPGETDDHDWNGYLSFDRMPQLLNPENGLIITANARVAGPRYKPYLTDAWDEPYRTARIYDLLHNKFNLRPADMLQIQTDVYSYPHVFLADQLLAASNVAHPQDPRAVKLIEACRAWNGLADANSAEVLFLDAVRQSLLALLLEPYLGKDTALYRWRRTAVLQKILTERPPNWLPPAYPSYDALLMAAADRAVARLTQETKSEHSKDWTWLRFNSLEMLHPMGHAGILKRLLSITSKPRPGTPYTINAATKAHGPAMRFVADLGDWDASIMLISTGESGQFGSSHYTDQFDLWYHGEPIIAPFSDAAAHRTTKHTLTLNPSP